ncbi:MAG TPA: dihydrolipoyl dehydrogenase [Bacteroidales bacterium]|jgi:dihydrolipoamide dehydrogenase|nr:dihydrolipoyl dehydrogenase [Bacteroidales bacterium]HNY58259.1 dihydrolipoyl dehydrogenase [Bacteroidales bacterium]HOH15583.1 dihydrolipoyl dehydrogenase [Bacteroidales bacterium]HPA69656.1 dihydrolipoyl dehydrogenase [Bacteroidales bacterium]HPX54629.1 dihydrolipoyl dehydrogenase [Bacteroidales bacterium]
MNEFDLIIIGSGPGGYVAAVRASQLGMKAALVEKAETGGICLNWGCVPTKALLKSAQVLEYARRAADYGINAGEAPAPDFGAVIARSRGVADMMSKGVQYLLKKYNVPVISGFGRLKGAGAVEVEAADGTKEIYNAKHIILATGARSRELPNLRQDGKKIIGYREAMTLPSLPESMVVVGSGAIGSEFAGFYRTMGTEVTLVEFMPRILPIEDEEVSRTMERSFKKAKMKVMVNSTVEKVDTTGEKCIVTIKTPRGDVTVEADIVLSAVGITPNIEGIGLEEAGVKTEKGRVVVDEFYRTSVSGIYAIGDIIPGPALAHVASAEAIVCVEKIAGKNPHPVDYCNIPGCTYTTPEAASCGMTEEAAKAAGIETKTGKFMFMASGKASAAGAREGFVKLVFNAADDRLIGGHLIGMNVTEMISSLVVAHKMGATAHDLKNSIHPHPTMSEGIMEAAAAALGEAIHG